MRASQASLAILCLALLPACSGAIVSIPSDNGTLDGSTPSDGGDVVDAPSDGLSPDGGGGGGGTGGGGGGGAAGGGGGGGGAGGGGGGGGVTPCGDALTCSPGYVCIVDSYSGGPCIEPEDGGQCPPGTTWTGGCCSINSTTYACKPMPPACNGTVSCACAQSLCSCSCQGATGYELDCVCLGAAQGGSAGAQNFR